MVTIYAIQVNDQKLVSRATSSLTVKQNIYYARMKQNIIELLVKQYL